MPALTVHSSPRFRPRRSLTPAHIAHMLDEDLQDPRLSMAEFVARCRMASDSHVAAVVCQPSRVALAAHLLAETEVRVAALAPRVSLLGQTLDVGHLLAQTETLLRDGATEIGILAPAAPLRGSTSTEFAKAIQAVADLAATHHAIVKVLLPAANMTADQLVSSCKTSVDSGATMVQGGTLFPQNRASLTQIALIRQALGDHVLLKWSAPIATLDRLLLASAVGVDRFNASTNCMLKQATERSRTSEIRIPEPGRDY